MKMRKLIAILSAVMMLCALLPMGAMTVSAADAVLFDDFSDGNTCFAFTKCAEAEAFYKGRTSEI